MYKYLMEIKNSENRNKVIEVLEPIVNVDLINKNDFSEKIKSLDVLKEIGENQVYDLVVEDLQEIVPLRAQMR